MDNYSVLADLLQTFRVMSDSVKVALIYMPGIVVAILYMIYLHHTRHRNPAPPPETQPYTILPPQKTPRERVTETMLALEKEVERVEELNRSKRL
ncbi:hypothetical protein [Agrobacterium larrymoorei]|uniref:Uncharacterized protein n=1 Tax=Agrobacterium larrymoorei TaxID=160699 RepID=A0AAF0H8D9_9HYPH|nr:hypothetical protein [Agrobacterium larrymoorei]WHA41716.1 hypothetical protein CFBP5477_003530 [Agrobacterium larrymoorei]